MQQLTPQAQKQIDELAQRYQVSTETVMTLFSALVNGNGTMAQFYHPELGGAGQWMRGGMVMVGDMFNHALKAKVAGLCSELAMLLAAPPFQPLPSHTTTQRQETQQQRQEATSFPDRGGMPPTGSPSFVFQGQSAQSWWPAGLGTPTTSGAQNSLRYAYFPQKQRLAIAVNGQVTLYDTGDHQISGVSQQQGMESSLTFTSQYGVVPVATLPIVPDSSQKSRAEMKQSFQNSPLPSETPQKTDVFATLERLAELKQKGIISDEEFNVKKAELLGKL